MKKLMLSAALAVGCTTTAQADPIFGIWQTEPDEGYYLVEMKQCGDTICGVITSRIDAEGNETGANVGRKLVPELTNDGGGAYSGSAWHPGRDKIFAGKAQLSGDSLRMKGCTFGGLICLGQDWTRVN